MSNKIENEEITTEEKEACPKDNKEQKESKVAKFIQKFNDEIKSYKENEEAVLERYAKFSLKNFHFISGALGFIFVLLYMPLNFKFTSQVIGLIVLIFTISVMLITKYYLTYKDNENIKVYIYDCWQKGISSIIIANFGLYAFSSNPHMEMLTILVFSTIATIVIQNGVKRSLSLL